MAYPAYDTYNNQVAFPISRRQSMAYTDGYGYEPPLTAGVYGEVSSPWGPPAAWHHSHCFQNYPQPAYPIYAPSRTMSQYNAGLGTPTPLP